MSIGKRGVVVPYLVVAAIAVFSLIVVGLLFTRAQTGHWIPDFIPDFNQTREGRSELALVRYVILQDRVDYYDGATWRTFGESGRELHGTIYNGAVLRRDLREHYFDTRGERRRAEPLMFEGEYKDYIVRIWELVFDVSLREEPLFFKSGTLRRGDVLVDVIAPSAEGKQPNFVSYAIRGPAGEVVFVKRGSERDILADAPVMTERIRQKALVWRESVLEKPVKVSNRDTSGQEHDVFVCMQRTTGSEDLVIDLSKGVNADTSCKSAV